MTEISNISTNFPGKIICWFVSPNSFIRQKQPIGLMMAQKLKYKIFKSPIRGVVQTIIKDRSTTFKPGEALIELREPTKPELKNFQIHENCQTDSRHEALHKLFLVLDLDHTLLHTGKEPEFASILSLNASSLIKFQSSPDNFSDENSQKSPQAPHCIKLRPYVFNFLNSLKDFFEQAVYTMGSREYANHIVAQLDSDNELFKRRIVSRDDNPNSRIKRMENLLKCDDANICIVDDSDTIWENKECVLKIQKYVFWPGEKGEFESEFSIIPFDYLKKRPKVSREDLKWEKNDTDSVLVSFKNILKSVYALYFFNLALAPKPTGNGVNNNIGYFDKTNLSLQPADTRYIMAQIKKSVLRNCTLYFVDCFPSNCNPSSQGIWLLSESFGANCVRALTNNVTHVIIGSLTDEAGVDYYEKHISMSNKYNDKGITVVSDTWVYDAAVHFRKPNELNHKFGVNTKDITDNTDDPVHYSDIIKRVFLMDYRYRMVYK